MDSLRMFVAIASSRQSCAAMRVVFLTHQFTRTGGPLVLLEIVEALSSRGVECYVVGPRRGPLLAEFKRVCNNVFLSRALTYLYSGSGSRLSQVFFLPVRIGINCYLQLVLVWYFLYTKADVIFLNSFASRYGIIAARFTLRPVVWYIHEYRSGSGIIRWAASLLIRVGSSRIATVSQAVRRHWGFAPDRDGVSVVHSAFAQEQDPNASVEADKTDLTFVGRISAEKGFDVLVDSLIHLAKRGLFPSVLAMGQFASPAFEQYIREKILALRPNQIIFCGEVEDVLSRLKQARILVFPSYREGLGRVVVEAMSCGLAVIASDVGGIPEIINSNKVGMLVPPGDPTALADAIEDLCGNESKRASLSSKGREHVLKHFTKDRFVREIENVVHFN